MNLYTKMSPCKIFMHLTKKLKFSFKGNGINEVGLHVLQCVTVRRAYFEYTVKNLNEI